jgi:pre-mRNA-splicing factor ATP-dependent RNA helicase DHX15/PRP43
MPKRRNRGQRGTREARHLSPESKAAGAGDADLRLRSDEGDAVRGILDQELNPFTLVQYTSQYRGILEARRKLPLFAQMDRFLDMVRESCFYFLLPEDYFADYLLVQ